VRRHPTIKFYQIAAGRLFFVIFAMAFLTGCPMQEDDVFSSHSISDQKRDTLNNARLNCFLNLKDDLGPAIKVEIKSIEVFAGNSWQTLNGGPLELDSTKIGTNQVFLGSVLLPPGHYQQIRLFIGRAEVRNSEGKYEIVDSDALQIDVKFPMMLTLDSGDSQTLLVNWDVQNSLLPNQKLDPVFTALPALRQIPLNLIYVSCPLIDTVFIVRTDKNWVVDSFGIPGRPTYMAIDPDTSSERLYVLSFSDRMVKVVDRSTHRVVDFFPAPLNDAPTFMTIDSSGRDAFLLDEQNGYLSRMNLVSGQIAARVQLGYRPTYAIYLAEQNILAVSLALSQKVLLLNPNSLAVMATFTTGSLPQGLAVVNNQLYIAESGDNTVLVTDLASSRNQSRTMVGFGPRRFVITDNQIYVSNYLDGSLSVLIEDQLGVVQEIYDLGRPQEMGFDSRSACLYVADGEKAALAVIDINIHQIIGNISLGSEPFGLAVIE
jgi:DNA-binding beta-propeller fold protein YncE